MKFDKLFNTFKRAAATILFAAVMYIVSLVVPVAFIYYTGKFLTSITADPGLIAVGGIATAGVVVMYVAIIVSSWFNYLERKHENEHKVDK